MLGLKITGLLVDSLTRIDPNSGTTSKKDRVKGRIRARVGGRVRGLVGGRVGIVVGFISGLGFPRRRR